MCSKSLVTNAEHMETGYKVPGLDIGLEIRPC